MSSFEHIEMDAEHRASGVGTGLSRLGLSSMQSGLPASYNSADEVAATVSPTGRKRQASTTSLSESSDPRITAVLDDNKRLREELTALQARVNVLNSPSYHHPSQGFTINAGHVPKPRYACRSSSHFVGCLPSGVRSVAYGVSDHFPNTAVCCRAEKSLKLLKTN